MMRRGLVVVWIILCGSLWTAPTRGEVLSVTTLAGQAGSSGSVDGTGSVARFSYPHGVAVDGSGNIYVGDRGNRTIRKVTPAGVVTTVAGLATNTGSADGTGSVARFREPAGVTVDGLGNIYVGDYGNHTIRKVTPAGVVTTVAGLATNFGNADGTGAVARFRGPYGVVADGSNGVYVADTLGSTIRKVTAAGVVTTVAGLAQNQGFADGTGTVARFDYPTDVTMDGSGNIYVADFHNHAIRKVTPAGVVTTVAAGWPLYGPFGVAVDGSGNVYVTHMNYSTIMKVTPAGVVTTVAGLSTNAGSADGTGTVARFSQPHSIAFDRAGDLYIADSDNNTIRKGVFTDAWDPADDAGAVASEFTPLVATNSHGPHTLSSTDQADWYKSYLCSGVVYTVGATGISGNTYGELFNDEGGTQLLVADDNSGGNQMFSFSYLATRCGWHYLRVRSAVAGESSHYTLVYNAGGMWSLATDLGGGWRWTDWFGFFAVPASVDWIYHNEHSWLYCFGTCTKYSIWFWTSDMGWLWTKDTTYPYFYRYNDGHWLWYLEGSSSPRWFCDMSTSLWESQ